VGKLTALQGSQEISSLDVFCRPGGRRLERLYAIDSLLAIVNFAFDLAVDHNSDIVEYRSNFKDIAVVSLIDGLYTAVDETFHGSDPGDVFFAVVTHDLRGSLDVFWGTAHHEAELFDLRYLIGTRV